MSILARASAAELNQYLADCPALPTHTTLRGPEAGLVMVRGRIGGDGNAFNVGEMTVTRCTVRAEGRIGHAYAAGRDGPEAELAARIDAALQDPAWHDLLQDRLIHQLAQAQDARRSTVASRAEATRVQFLAMATMRS
jgi:alpha-D-ribose 1-methylphosphonate 5-triphosphate synthase subunit PhnG